MRNRRRSVMVFCVAVLWLPPLSSLAQSPEGSFTGATATALLDQIASALVAHSPSRMLAAFDLSKMTDGPLFKQQTTVFFRQTEIIRVHFNQIETSIEGGKGVVTLQAEIDAEPSDVQMPALHKQAQLRLVAEPAGRGWKFTDIQPRTFFSIQP
jgi:hypothetical protein